VDMTCLANTDFKPNLYDVHKILETTVVGEHQTRLAIFSNWVLAEKYIMISGGSRSGKSWIKNAIIELIKERVYSIKQGSAKSGWRDAQEIQKASYIDIPELNQIPLDMLEVLKSWGEQKDAQYQVVDTLTRGMTKYNLPYRPFVFCMADENSLKVPEELRYRLTEIRLSSDKIQNRMVLKHQAMLALLPENPKKIQDEEFNRMKDHLKYMPSFTENTFKHPASEILVDAIPDRFADCRTAFPIYLDNTYGIQRFYWKESIKGVIGKQKKPVWFVSPQSMWLNHVIFGNILINSSLKCTDLQKRILEIAQKYNAPFDRKYMQKEVHKMGIDLSSQMIVKHLDKMVEIGYLDKQAMGTTWEVSDFFENFKFTINWKKVIETSVKNMKKYYPDYADEYIRLYCNNPTCVHPFTGETVNIVSYDLSKDKVTEDGLYLTDKTTKKEIIVEETIGDTKETSLDSIRAYFKANSNRVNANAFDEKYGLKMAKSLLEEGSIIEMPKGWYVLVGGN